MFRSVFNVNLHIAKTMRFVKMATITVNSIELHAEHIIPLCGCHLLTYTYSTITLAEFTDLKCKYCILICTDCSQALHLKKEIRYLQYNWFKRNTRADANQLNEEK